MSRIQTTFESLQAHGKKALIPFFTVGDPTPEAAVSIMHTLVASGADIIELGIPFSDPMADGPVIQRSSERALKFGVSLKAVLASAAEFRKTNSSTPLVLMGYANPIEQMGTETFADLARASGIDGVLVVDSPPEESEAFVDALRARDIDSIFLLSPTSTDSRIQKVGRLASGYVYYVSLRGVTGAANIDTQDVAEQVARIRNHVNVPVGVGFGIRDGETARRVSAVADAIVVGSRLILAIEEAPSTEAALQEIGRLTREFREAMDEGALGSAR